MSKLANIHYELKDISCFVKLASSGSLSKASRAHSIPKSTLGYHLQRLEDSLSVQLFKRRTDGLELTEAGREYFEYAREIFRACELAASAAQRKHQSIGGDVRIVGSSEFGTSILGPAAAYLLKEHPQLSFDLRTYPKGDLMSGEINFDCMIYVGDPPDANLLRRKLGDFCAKLYASPAFIARNERIDDLKALSRTDGVLNCRNGVPEIWNVVQDSIHTVASCYPRFKVDNYWLAKYFAVEAVAVAYLPDFFTHYEMSSGALVQLLPGLQSPTSSIYILYPAQRHRNPRVMKVIEALCSGFEKALLHPSYHLVRQAP